MEILGFSSLQSTHISEMLGWSSKHDDLIHLYITYIIFYICIVAGTYWDYWNGRWFVYIYIYTYTYTCEQLNILYNKRAIQCMCIHTSDGWHCTPTLWVLTWGRLWINRWVNWGKVTVNTMPTLAFKNIKQTNMLSRVGS